MDPKDKIEEINMLIAVMGFVPRTVLAWSDTKSIQTYLKEYRDLLKKENKE